MRSELKLVVCVLILMMPALCEDVDYLGVVEPNGTIVGANYPEYLGWYLNETPEKVAIDYSLYTPTFEEFMLDGNNSGMNESKKLGLGNYPSWMRKYLEN